MKLFSYNTICTSLYKNTKTLRVTLNRPESNNEITLETLYELETILNWAYPKVEIASIQIDSSSDIFSMGLNKEKMINADREKILKLREKLFDIHLLMLQLPQTVIVDLGSGANNIALEMAMAADLRVSSINAGFRLNNLELGIPLMHGHHLSSGFINSSQLKNWINFSKKIPLRSLLESGFIIDCYDSSNRDDLLKNLLKNIVSQSPISRIQTKLIQNIDTIKSMKRFFQEEMTMIRAALSSSDWQSSDDEFKSAKEVREDIKSSAKKMTLIPGGKSDIIT